MLGNCDGPVPFITLKDFCLKWCSWGRILPFLILTQCPNSYGLWYSFYLFRLSCIISTPTRSSSLLYTVRVQCLPNDELQRTSARVKGGCWKGWPCTAALIAQRGSAKASESLSNVKQCVGGALFYQQCVSRLMSRVMDPPCRCYPTIYSKCEHQIESICSFSLNSSHLLPSLSGLLLIFFRGRSALEFASLRMKTCRLQWRWIFWGRGGYCA